MCNYTMHLIATLVIVATVRRDGYMLLRRKLHRVFLECDTTLQDRLCSFNDRPDQQTKQVYPSI